jgi:hypothetical protein
VRRYGAYSYSGDREQGQVEIGATHCTVTMGRSSTLVVAAILDRAIDPASGVVIALVLDRLVVPHHTTAVGPWRVSGAYVTQLSRAAPGRTQPDPWP